MLFLLAVTRKRETIGSYHESSNKIPVILGSSGQNIIVIVIEVAVKMCSDYQEKKTDMEGTVIKEFERICRN